MSNIWVKHYQKGVPAEINPDVYPSLIELFTINCKKFSHLPALSNLDCQLTYGQLADFSHHFAAFLQQKLGLRKGERLAIMLPNVLQYPVVLFGALKAGLIVVNVNPLYTVPELVHQINDSGAETIVVLANFAHVVQKALPQTRLKNIIVTELADLFPWFKSIIVNAIIKYVKKMVPAWSIPHAISFKNALKEGAVVSFEPVAINSQDTAFLQYTGGTTGVAKGAELTHRNMLANIEQVLAWVRPTLQNGKEIIVTPLPLYHIFSLTANCLAFICLGSLNILITNPRDIAHLISELGKHRFTTITGVNTLFNALLNHPDFAKVDFSHLKIALGGGAAVQKTVAERWLQVTNKPLYVGYGLTETSPVVCITPFDRSKYDGSIGLPVSSTSVSLRDDKNNEVPEGQIGELCVKGPQVMKGYWYNEAETRKVFTEDGWLRTGDMARIDEQGFVYLTERKKDMILVSGFNVYPNEVEEVIAANPGVLEVAVIGIPDTNSGESVKAFVVKKDPQLTADSLLAYCRQHLTGYKLPKHIEFRDSLPKSPIGKILRRALRDEEKAVGH